MEFISTEIPDVKIVIPKRFGDARGFFSEIYNKRDFARAGIELEFVQDNHSRSTEKGVIRGLHYQIEPHAQAKLVRVVRGSVLDVAVDIRRHSPSFGQHVKVVLSQENWRQALIPPGFAHAFVTLEPNTEVIYKVTDYYAPDHERGLLWSDPKLGIDWGIEAAEAILSERDRQHPRLADQTDLF